VISRGAIVRRIEPQISLDTNFDIPLVVDLDRTLILTDTLQEALARLLFSRPIRTLTSFSALLQGRAAFKAKSAEQFYATSNPRIAASARTDANVLVEM
jgi:hypothetical protein